MRGGKNHVLVLTIPKMLITYGQSNLYLTNMKIN